MARETLSYVKHYEAENKNREIKKRQYIARKALVWCCVKVYVWLAVTS